MPNILDYGSINRKKKWNGHKNIFNVQKYFYPTSFIVAESELVQVLKIGVDSPQVMLSLGHILSIAQGTHQHPVTGVDWE